jgi:hypothetical protein
MQALFLHTKVQASKSSKDASAVEQAVRPRKRPLQDFKSKIAAIKTIQLSYRRAWKRSKAAKRLSRSLRAGPVNYSAICDAFSFWRSISLCLAKNSYLRQSACQA